MDLRKEQMNFEKLYSESGFIRDLAFKKLFLEIPEFLNFVYKYSLQLLVLPFDDTIDLLDNNVNDNINIKNRETDLLYESSKYLVNIEGNSQTSISVNLKNLSYLCALLLRQVKTGEEDRIKNVIQININNHSPFKTKNFINITKLIDSITGEVRNGQIAIVDFNLDYYDDIAYNEIDSLPDADPRKIFYLFTRENNDKYYGLYKNSKLGKMLVRRMEMMIENFDAIFYYDKDKFNEQVAKEVGFEEGKAIGLNEGRNKGIAIGLDKGKREIILRMLNNNVSDSDIIKYSGVTESELEDIKKSIGK